MENETGVIILLTCNRKRSFRKTGVVLKRTVFLVFSGFFDFFSAFFGFMGVCHLLSFFFYFFSSSCSIVVPLPLLPLRQVTAPLPLLPLGALTSPLLVLVSAAVVIPPITRPRPVPQVETVVVVVLPLPLLLTIRRPRRRYMMEGRRWLAPRGSSPLGSPWRHRGQPELYWLRMYPQIHTQQPGALPHCVHRMAWCRLSS